MYDWAAQASAKPFRKTARVFRVTILGVGFTKKHRVFPLLAHHLFFADPNIMYVGEDRSLDDTIPRTFFCGEYGGVRGHRYDDLIATKLAGSSRRERGQAGYQRHTRDNRSHAPSIEREHQELINTCARRSNLTKKKVEMRDRA